MNPLQQIIADFFTKTLTPMCEAFTEKCKTEQLTLVRANIFFNKTNDLLDKALPLIEKQIDEELKNK